MARTGADGLGGGEARSTPNLRAAMGGPQSCGEHTLSLRYACALVWFCLRFATR